MNKVLVCENIQKHLVRWYKTNAWYGRQSEMHLADANKVTVLEAVKKARR